MITLTRIRQNTPFILNPDLIERVDTHVDTVVRLTSGTEYVVNETGDEIVRRTAEFRARVLALAGTLTVESSQPPAAQEPAPSPAPAADVWAPASPEGPNATAAEPPTEPTDGEPGNVNDDEEVAS